MGKSDYVPKSRNKMIAILVIMVVGLSGVIVYTATEGFTNNPFDPTDGQTTVTTNTTATVQQGVKITGTATYANTTPITSQTLYGLDADNNVVLIATITSGAFTSNRGPAEGGLLDLYVAITGCILYVGQYDLPSAASYDQESVTIGTVVVYTSSSTYTAQLIGATSNSYTSGGSAGTTNYTQSASVEELYTMRVTNTLDYSILFRQYTDPRDDIVVEPVLWIEVAATNGYTQTAGINSWSDSTKTYFLVPLDAVTCEGTLNVALVWNFGIVMPTAGTYAFSAYIVDGSSMSHLLQAKSRVSDPATAETVSATQIVSAYMIVS